MTKTAEETVTEYNETRDKLKKMRKDYQKAGKELFKTYSVALFDQYPKLKEFRWTQYTAYFNDGEPCTFSAHTDDPHVNGMDYYDRDEKEEGAKEWEAMYKAVQKHLTQFESEDYELWFGDHVEVVVTRKGVKVTEYNHD